MSIYNPPQGVNAVSLNGLAVKAGTPPDGQVLTYIAASGDVMWTAVSGGGGGAPSGPAGGDLSGTFPNPSVAKIEGITLQLGIPPNGQVLTYVTASGSAMWAAAAGGAPTGAAGGDLAFTYPNPQVSGLQGTAINNIPAVSGQLLTYNATAGKLQWQNPNSQEPMGYYNVLLHGCKGDGVTDDSTALNAATQYCQTNKLTMMLPKGHTFLVSGAPWMIYGATGTTFFINEFQAEGLAYKNGENTGPTIKCVNPQIPACIIQSACGVRLKGITFIGANTQLISNPSPTQYLAVGSGWVNNNCRDSKNSPHGGIVFDPFPGNGSLSPDGGYTYPSVSGFYGYTGGDGAQNTIIEDCQILGFVVDILNGASGNNELGTSITVRSCVLGESKVCIAEGSSQADGCKCTDVTAGSFYTFFDNVSYGSQNGNNWSFEHGEINSGKYLVKLANDTEAIFNMVGLYGEGLGSIGYIGAGLLPVNFISCDFNFENLGVGTTSDIDWQLWTASNVKFMGCTLGPADGGGGHNACIRMSVTGGQFGLPPTIDFDNCFFWGDPGTNDLIAHGPFAGNWNNGVPTNAYKFRNCAGFFNGNHPSKMDMEVNVATLNSIIGTPVFPGTEIIAADTNSIYKVSINYNTFQLQGAGPTINVSGLTGVATFQLPASAVPSLAVGDSLVLAGNTNWSSEQINESVNIPSFGCIGNVVGINASNLVTLNNVPQHFTTQANNLSVVWAPIWHKAQIATITNGSPVLSGVTFADWNVGNHITGVGIPAGTRVIAVGSNNLTMSASGNVTGTTFPFDATYTTYALWNENGDSDQIQPNPLAQIPAGLAVTSQTAYFQYAGTPVVPTTIQHITATSVLPGSGLTSVEVGVFSATSGPSNANKNLTNLASQVCSTSLPTNGAFKNTSNLNCVVPPNTPIYLGILVTGTVPPTLGAVTDTASWGYIQTSGTASTFASTISFPSTKTAYAGAVGTGVMLNHSPS